MTTKRTEYGCEGTKEAIDQTRRKVMTAAVAGAATAAIGSDAKFGTGHDK